MGDGLKEIIEHYDAIAADYDRQYSGAEYMAVNEQLIAMIEPRLPPGARILDLGCGTGLFLGYVQWDASRYVGIEPSAGMCEVFRGKHPEYRIINSYLTRELVDDFRPDVFFGLYGVGDYLSLADIDLVLSASYFMMFSAPGHDPAILSQAVKDRITPERNLALFRSPCVTLDGKYIVTSDLFEET